MGYHNNDFDKDFDEDFDEEEEDNDYDDFDSEITDVYCVVSSSTKTARNGDVVTNYVLRNNKNGYMNAVQFNSLDMCREGDIIKVTGTTGFYNNLPQINISQFEILQPTTKNVSLVMPSSVRSIEDIKTDANLLISRIENEKLRYFVSSLINSYPLFYTAPAGKRIHHAWIGGLSEHSVQVAKIASHMVGQYKCNMDITIAGALLHDIGKVHEIEMAGSISYSDMGRLMGHTYIGAQMVDAHSRAVGCDDFVLNDIKHIILSHHGKQEHGAVVTPSTLEALLVYLSDMMDAGMIAAIEQIKWDKNAGNWTAYDHSTGMAFRKTIHEKFLTL